MRILPEPLADNDMHTQPSSTRRDHCPALRIHHLLAWTAVTAILLNAFRIFAGGAYFNGSGLAFILSGSAGVTFLGFAKLWKNRGEYCRSPGHGFLVVAAVWLALRTAHIIMNHWVGYRTTVLIGNYYNGSLLWNRIELIVIPSVVLIGCFVFADTFRWRVVYSILFVGRAALFLHCIGSEFQLFGEIGIGNSSGVITGMNVLWVLREISFPAALLALLWAVFRDKRLGVSRDWTHWLGIACWCGLFFLSAIYAPRRLALEFLNFFFV